MSFSTLPDARSYVRKDGTHKYAIVTMLILNDGYLPSLIMFAQSLRNVDEEMRKRVDLVCIVTPDIPAYTRGDLRKFFDHVVEMPYLKVDPSALTHKNPATREIYARTFTKMQTWLLVQYDKVVFCDADMIVLKREFYNLLTLDTPAGIFFGCYRPFYDADQRLQYETKVAPRVQHGAIIPRALYSGRCRTDPKDPTQRHLLYIGVESSIMVLTPDANDYDALLKDMQRMPRGRYSGDSLFLSKHFEGRWHHVDVKFMGRWMNPEDDDEVVVLDLYGSEGKPWQLNKLESLAKYPDVQYWWRRFTNEYPEHFRDVVKDPAVHQLYKTLMSDGSPMEQR